MKFNNERLILVVYLVYLSGNSSGKLPEKLRNIKKKWEKFTKGQGKGHDIFADINPLEYPWGNDTLREFHQERWNDYYKCLKTRHSTAGDRKTLYPSAIVTMEGSSIILPCGICISPSEYHTIESIDWFYNSTTDTNMTSVPVSTDEHTLISPSDRTLQIFNTALDKEGFYWCQLEDTMSNPYYVHVSNETDALRIVQGDEAPDALHPEPPVIIDEYGLRIFSDWSDWSSCSKCNIVGRKQRYGYCSIELVNYGGHHIRRKRNNDVNEPLDSDADLGTVIEKILIFFGNKLPCRSIYTPQKIQELAQIKNRKNELMRKFCKIKCEETVIFEIRDKSGNVIESANNSAGIYSVLQGVPEPLPSVQRETLYIKHGSKAELKCPGNLNSDTPMTWQIASKSINPLSISDESNGRISLDPHDRLIFKRLRFTDTNIYSCWQMGKLAGTIRLEVAYEVEFKIDHRVMMIGAIAILSTFIVVFFRAFRGRRRYTKH
ncbi:Ig-like V-type domain-containing protein FAM187A [Fopius arisanus]|uniref:Ig-like V-type domain-containing protein FAM187A n=1 Tax=Fopius arisanus TaxID=64838 RepID=A0A9R1TMT2_9HYME|nr:PREDICTED: Ig-like V-type domain-containing protein FAM187A [Fopius arisanus]